MQTLPEDNRLSRLKRTGCDITTAVAFAFYVATFWAALTAQPGIIFNPTRLAAQTLLGARFIPPIMVYASRLNVDEATPKTSNSRRETISSQDSAPSGDIPATYQQTIMAVTLSRTRPKSRPTPGCTWNSS